MENKNSTNDKYRAQCTLKSSANWFYWIAGLSMINTLVMLFDGSISFVVGLGATQFIDAFASAFSGDSGTIISVIAFFMDLFISGVFVIFGYFANKGYKWSFIVGIVLYALDGLVFIFVKDFLSIAFHGYAIYCIYRGVKALKYLEQVDKNEVLSGDTGEENIYEGKNEIQSNYLKQIEEFKEEKNM